LAPEPAPSAEAVSSPSFKRASSSFASVGRNWLELAVAASSVEPASTESRHCYQPKRQALLEGVKMLPLVLLQVLEHRLLGPQELWRVLVEQQGSQP
jgi:hypothetical protein